VCADFLRSFVLLGPERFHAGIFTLLLDDVPFIGEGDVVFYSN